MAGKTAGLVSSEEFAKMCNRDQPKLAKGRTPDLLAVCWNGFTCL